MTKRHLFIFVLILAIPPLSINGLFAQKTSLILRYDAPTTVWTEALPLGNDYMGAMLFGSPLKEHLQLNEGTLYSGDPRGKFKNIHIRKHFKAVTDLIKAQKYQEAQTSLFSKLSRN